MSRPGPWPRGALWRAALVLWLASSPVHAAGWSEEKSGKADAMIARFLERLDREAPDLPKAALVFGVATADGLVAAKGYREAAPGIPATAHTVYHVGSLAKQFTAAAVLDLIDRHAALRDRTPLTLDLALSRVFAGVQHWPGAGATQGEQPVTLRSLLTMTSNLPNFTRLPPPSTDPWGRIAAPDLLSEIKRFNPSGWPNTFEYSNTSYFLLAEMIEEAVLPGEAGPMPHRDYLRRAIFPRAHLAETGFVGDPAPGSVEAVAIHRRPRVFDQPDWLKGSADIASSVADMAAWNEALMSGRMLPDGSRAEMLGDGARVTPDIYYGMGWFIEHKGREDIYSHSGFVPGFTSYNVIAADAAASTWMSITVLVNTDVPEGMETLARDLLQLARD
ncbi:MAG: serine hydrolase domain-containing protein [Hyphomicrobium sp.]|uniref:serine hydrolase domain-containing protein n=1 Tax=Hyphomicrobium sp. TaxID=82 RepID=UPI003D0F2C7C